MNPDHVVGTAVLRTSMEAGKLHWLHYLKVGTNYPDGAIGLGDLPVLPHGVAAVEQPPSWFKAIWRYNIVGNVLHVTPSVHIYGHWHNDGQWSVPFVYADGQDTHSNYTQLLRVNPDLELSRFRECVEKWC